MATRTRVLSAFKELHRTCQSVYNGDRRALRASRWKINREFKRFKTEESPKKIEDHIQFARDASRLVRLTSVQGVAERRETSPGDTHSGQRKSNHWHSERRPHRNYMDDDDDDMFYDHDRRQGQGRHQGWKGTGRVDQYSKWGDDYPYYANDRHKPQHKKKPRHVDSSNFDLSRMLGKRR